MIWASLYANLRAMSREERLRYQAKRLFSGVERHEVADGYIFDFRGEVEVIELRSGFRSNGSAALSSIFVSTFRRVPPVSLRITEETGIKE